MGNITTHFSAGEFACPCCGGNKILTSFVERLEKLHSKMGAKSIVISSGYRCPIHSVSVGGYANDTHVMGFGADLIVYRKDGKPYTSMQVARVAETLGFGGIGIIDNYYVHLDTRDENEYSNKHWFGNEKTGETYTTFQAPGNSPEIEIVIDGESYYISGVKKIIINKE